MENVIRPRCRGLFGVHRFEARYDKGPADLGQFTELRGAGITPLAETMRKITYARDVCVKCGAVLERKAYTPAEGEIAKGLRQ